MVPSLGEPYAAALDGAVAYIHERYQPIGIIAGGTIIRGTPDAGSDFDFVVIHQQTWRQRTQRFFNGVPAEMFVNPEFQMRRVIAAEPAGGRPVMSHLIGTGEILHDSGGIMASLKALAGEILDAGPAVPPEDLTQMRYRIATAFEDAHDIRDVDPDRAHSIVTEALTEAVRLHFLQEGRWLPRYKVLLADLDDLDPDLGHATRSALGCPDLDERLDLATPIIQRIVDATGFFEWESVPQDLGQ